MVFLKRPNARFEGRIMDKERRAAFESCAPLRLDFQKLTAVLRHDHGRGQGHRHRRGTFPAGQPAQQVS